MEKEKGGVGITTQDLQKLKTIVLEMRRLHQIRQKPVLAKIE